MLELGGYFGEERQIGSGKAYHDVAALKSGRACARLLIRYRRPARAFLPYFCCDSLVRVFESCGVLVQRYCLNEAFELKKVVQLGESDCLVVLNYFGLKSNYIRRLIQIYGDQLWVDDTQAFFERGSGAFSFNSARKFFGVTDGAYIYAPDYISHAACRLHRAENMNRLHLHARTAEGANAGYTHYLIAERSIDGELERISEYSEQVLDGIDYSSVIAARKANFGTLNELLAESNLIDAELLAVGRHVIPFAYPFIPGRKITHNSLWARNLFAPLLWPECKRWSGAGCYAIENHTRLLPLPIDHRYGSCDMESLVERLKSI